MNYNKIILILIGILVAVGLIIGAIIYLGRLANPTSVSVSQPIQNVNEPVNINQPLTKEQEAEKVRQNPILYRQAIVDQKIAYLTYYSLMEFQAFCNLKENNLDLSMACQQVLETDLFGDKNEFLCKKEVNFESSLYYLKTNQKDQFLKICEESKELSNLPENYKECNMRWETKILADKEFCDDAGKGCPVLLTEDKINACQNIINVNTVGLDKLIDVKCQKEVPLRRAANASDCQGIADDLTRLVCLEMYEKKACQDIKKAINLLTLPDFIQKYNIKNCCFGGDEAEKEKMNRLGWL